MRSSLTTAIIVLCWSLVLVAAVSVPTLITYQGKLTDDVGNPVPDDTYYLEFTIYNDSTSGTDLWYESHPAVVTNDGLFNVQLGLYTKLGAAVAAAGPDLFVEIAVEKGAALAPRTRLTTSMFSLRASTVDDAAIDAAAIEDDAVLLNHIAQNGAAVGEVLKWNGAAWTTAPMNSGDITGVKAGLGLDGGGTSGDVDLDLDTAFTEARYVNVPGDKMTGDLNFDYLNNGTTEVQVDVSEAAVKAYSGGTLTAKLEGSGNDGSLSLFNSSGTYRTRIYGNIWGEINLYDQSGDVTAVLEARSEAGGALNLNKEDGTDGLLLSGGSTSQGSYLGMRNTAGTSTIILDAGMTGDDAVRIPDNAISAEEILNEPGITRMYGSTDIDIVSAGFTEVMSGSIIVPAAGYIMVHGYGFVTITGSSIGNVAICINTLVAATGVGNLKYVGSDTEVLTASMTRYYDVMVENTFWAPTAGTYTYYLVAYRSQSAGAAKFYSAKMVMTYYPVSYGTVSAFVSGAEATEFDESTPVSATSLFSGESAPAATIYQVDLRELELKAARARAAAEQAERELLEAQIQQVRQARTQNE